MFLYEILALTYFIEAENSLLCFLLNWLVLFAFKACFLNWELIQAKGNKA